MVVCLLLHCLHTLWILRLSLRARSEPTSLLPELAVCFTFFICSSFTVGSGSDRMRYCLIRAASKWPSVYTLSFQALRPIYRHNLPYPPCYGMCCWRHRMCHGQLTASSTRYKFQESISPGTGRRRFIIRLGLSLFMAIGYIYLTIHSRDANSGIL